MFRFIVFMLVLNTESVLCKSVSNITSIGNYSGGSLKKEVEFLKGLVYNLTERIDRVVPEQKYVFFFVRLTPATTLNKNSIVKFDQVITDSGKNFNSGDGVFVAPVGGYYQFSWTTFTYPSKALETELRVDNKIIDSLYGYVGTSSSVPATKVVICKVKKGDHVWIQTTSVYTDNTFHLAENSRSSFTGLLIQEQ